MKNWNELLEKSPMLKIGIEVLEILGGNSLIVGGTPRDLITGEKEPEDIDIATNVPMDKIKSLFKTFDLGRSEEFGIIVINYKDVLIEIAQFRTESDEYSNSRHPDSVEYGNGITFKQDASRRDFSVNSLGLDSKGNIIDHFGGLKSIKNKVIKTVGNPDKRFKEDALRLIRAVRFSSRLGFDIEPETKKSIQKHSKDILKVSPERITAEILKMAKQSGNKFADAIILLDEVGLLEHILPEIVKSKSLPHTLSHHPEGPFVWDHIISALRSNESNDPIINISILFHDVGKNTTYALSDEGKHTYLSHEREGIELLDKIAKRMKLDNKTRDTIIFASANHMKMHNFIKMSNSKIIKLIKDDNWDVLLNVAIADAKSRGKKFYDKKEFDAVKKKVEELTVKYKSDDAQASIRKVINGGLVMKLTGLKPGPKLGEVINTTLEWMLDNNISPTNSKKIHNYIKEFKV